MNGRVFRLIEGAGAKIQRLGTIMKIHKNLIETLILKDLK
jgi:hypothetical protein